MGEPARAYDQPVHEYLSRRAFREIGEVMADPGSATNLLRRVWETGAHASDPALRARFVLRYPNGLDAWQAKELFALNPEKSVVGFDTPPAAMAARDLYAKASRLPDDDSRNRDRFAHDAQHQLIKDSWNQPLPDDPATLEMGGATGLSSQAHAHYGLPHLQFSDDPEVLKKDPRRFAVPPTVHTFGAEFAEAYTDLAVVALAEGDRALAVVFAGNAAHHIEDVANQIHTVQVGIYEFFVDAKVQSLLQEALSVGGLLRSRPTFLAIGIDIISNHHTLAESLYAKHLLTDGDPVAKQTAQVRVDERFSAQLAQQLPGCEPGFARRITETLIETSSYEGPEVYGEIRKAAQRRWSHAGEHFSGDPDQAIRPGADLTAFFALEVAGAGRALTALDWWFRHFTACAQRSDALQLFGERMIAERLDAIEAKEARARSFEPKTPESEKINPWVAVGYLVAVALLYAFARTLPRRQKEHR